MDTTDTLPRVVRLEHQAIYSLADAAGVEVVCGEGTVWLTLDNDPRDYVLEAGETFTTAEHRPALVYALAPSRIALRARQSRKHTIETFNRFHSRPLMKAAR
ncbi:MAG: DUF2917 domain-containing protein [Microvirga sp.]